MLKRYRFAAKTTSRSWVHLDSSPPTLFCKLCSFPQLVPQSIDILSAVSWHLVLSHTISDHLMSLQLFWRLSPPRCTLSFVCGFRKDSQPYNWESCASDTWRMHTHAYASCWPNLADLGSSGINHMCPMQTAAMYEEIVQNMAQEQTLNNHSIISTKDTATSWASMSQVCIHTLLVWTIWIHLVSFVHTARWCVCMSNAFEGKFQKSCA